MLGCHDFCGYYDWTFHYIQRRFGDEAVKLLWSESIGFDSQIHYLIAGQQGGLKGLEQCWNKTGVDEHCDWTFQLNEDHTTLRWDMRECPSKGFLLANDLNADEDYCDHCMGWMKPLLDKVGVEIAVHEHNHCGQCWGEMRVRGKPYEPFDSNCDIKKDARWKEGYVDRWEHNEKQPVLGEFSKDNDPSSLIINWFARADEVTVLGRGPSALNARGAALPQEHVVITSKTYVTRDVFEGEPLAVMIGDGPTPQHIQDIAARYAATPKEKRPLLMFAYLPSDLNAGTAFAAADMPRPVAILPLLIRAGLYRHESYKAYPTTGVFATLVAVATGKKVHVAGIDLYRHPSGRTYAAGEERPGDRVLPKRHSRECDVKHLRRAMEKSEGRLDLAPDLFTAEEAALSIQPITAV